MEWISANETFMWWLATGSVAMFIVTLVLVPVAVIRIPPNYFVAKRDQVMAKSHPLPRALWRVAKPILGTVLIIMGILMLVLPGQGIITILLGIMLLDFPGRHRLQYWLVSRPQVTRSVNWLRRRAGREPLVLHTQSE